MASSAEQVLELKRQAIVLKEAGDTNGAMALLAQARDLEFENASVEDLWDVLKLKQFAVVCKKRGDLDSARQALAKAKQIEKEGLTQPPAPADQPQPQQEQQKEELSQPAGEPAQSDSTPKHEASPPKPQQASVVHKEEETSAQPPALVEEGGNDSHNDNNKEDDEDAALRALMQLDQPDDTPMNMDDVAFSLVEMADHEMMTEFKLGGMPVPSEEEYQAKILACKKNALAAKKAGDTSTALQELAKSKQLEKVRVALSQINVGVGVGVGDNNDLVDDGWMNNLNAEESELLGELLPQKKSMPTSDEGGVSSDPSIANNAASSRLEEVLEELAGFLEDPALFMDALDMGMEVPSVEEVEAKAEEYKMMAVECKKAGNMEGAKANLIKSKQFTAHGLKLKTVLEQVEQKKEVGNRNGAVKLEDLEAMLEADEKKSKQPNAAAAAAKAPSEQTTPAQKTSDQLKEEAIKLRDQKKIKEAGEVLKLYKAALKREQDAAELAKRKELVGEIQREIDFARHQIRIFEYYKHYCDPNTQQVVFWKEYMTRCGNVSKVIMAKGTGAVNIVRKKTTMLSARQEREDGEAEDFNVLVADLLDRGTNSDPPDERLEISIQSLDKVQENSNLQKLFKKQKRENLPEHPAIIRLDVNVQLPPNENDTEKSIDLVYEPSSMDPLKKLELTTSQSNEGDPEASNCVLFEKSQYVELPRGNSAYGKMIRRRIERNKRITISVYHAPVAEKKGWFFKMNKEELPDPTLLGKVVIEMQGLLMKKCCAAGEYPLMNGSGSKELGGVLKLAVRSGTPFAQPGEKDDSEEQVNRTKLEHYTAMVFSLNKEEPPAEATQN